MQPGPGGRRRKHFLHQRNRNKKPGSGKGPPPRSDSQSPARKKRRVKPTSSFSAPVPSSASIHLPEKKAERPVWLSYLTGLLGVTLLILLGGGHNAYALSLALFMPGLALVLSPPKSSPGIWMDRAAVALLASFLLAFIPQFYWPDPEWRKVAVDSFSMDLPWVLSVQPRISWEAWLCALAGFAWFYAVTSWRINHNGRKWFYFALCLVVGVLASIVIWGNVTGARYPAAEDSNAFSFFPNRNQTANFLALGGVVSFCYAMSSLRTRWLVAPFLGFIVSGICFLALVGGNARAGVFLFSGGVLLWFLLQLRTKTAPRAFKIGFPLLLLGFSLFISMNSQATGRVLEFVTQPGDWASEFRSQIYADSVDMFLEAPLSGFGLGTFKAVFPQYRYDSANYQIAVHPESDFFWLATETGLLGVALFGVFLGAYCWRCRGLSTGHSGVYRMIALVAVIVFLAHAMVDVPGHRPGTVYFAILFAALALPRSSSRKPTLKPMLWRSIGIALLLFSLVWGVAGMTGMPLHSTTATEQYEERVKESITFADYENGLRALDDWLKWEPLDWRVHFQKGMLTLLDTGERGKAAGDFRRARFLEPILGVVTFEEGFVWLPYDIGRTLSAWRETLSREMDDSDGAFRQMIDAAANNPELMNGLARISESDLHYRYLFLKRQRGMNLMVELQRELSKEPALSQFSRLQRTEILKQWVNHGDHDLAGVFLSEYSNGVNRPWWLWSLLRKNQADFKEAVEYILEGVAAPVVPEVKIEEGRMERVVREFNVAPTDVMKGTALMQAYLSEGNYLALAEVTDAMISSRNNVPPYVSYWKAESLYRLEDYIESWYAFESYFEQLWEAE